MTTDPAFEIEDRTTPFRQSVIVPPTPNIAQPTVPQLFAGSVLLTIPELANSNLETFQAFWRYLNLAIPSDSKTQKLPFPGSAGSTLFRIHFQSQVLLNPFWQALDQSVCRGRTAHVDVASSSPGELHPQALTEPDVNLSAHPALIVQSQVGFHAPTMQKAEVLAEPHGPASEQPYVDGFAIV